MLAVSSLPTESFLFRALNTLFIDFKQAPSLDRASGNTCSAYACRLFPPPLFKTCIRLMNTFWRMERGLLECTLTQVWSRAALCPLGFPLCVLMTLMRLLRVSKALSQAQLVPLWRTCCMLMIWLWCLMIQMRCRLCSTVYTVCSEKAPRYP